MKIILIVTTIVTFANGHVDNSLSRTKILPTPYSSYHQCEYNGERFVERETMRLTDLYSSQHRKVDISFQCTKIDSE